jgi:tRNA1(Val) A37 N6-methylase TrmN6
VVQSLGIVRPARRPPSWRAPGPQPAGGDDTLGPRAGEDLCYLAGDWRILQRLDGHRWSLDDLVTAHVAADEGARGAPPARIVDLGCGIGTVAMLLAWRFAAAEVIGVEAQATSVDLARRSIAWNGAAARCTVRHADFRDPGALDGLDATTLVTATPPYLPPADATASPNAQRARCRIELAGGIEGYGRAAASILARDGRLVVCAAARQHARVAAAAAAAGLAAVRRLEVVPRAGKAPLFAVHVLARTPAPVVVEPPLVVRDAGGRRTDAFVAVRAAFGMPP